MMSMTKTSNTAESTPKVRALELKGFAEGVQRLVEHIEAGQRVDTSKERLTPAEKATLAGAEQAALALLRNAPLAIRAIRGLEGFADEYAQVATGRRDEIMTSMFGPDDE
jgi:hypothetical protein